jgi:carbamate kinase
VIATDVPQVAVDFGKPSQRFLDHLTIAEAKKHLAAGQFPAGNMGPKIEAAVDFLEHGGERVVIADLEHLVPAVAGKAGTRIARK